MEHATKHESECAARLLAWVVASSGRVDARELATLDELAAFERLGVSRARCVALAHEAVRAQAPGADEPAWLAARKAWQMDPLLDAVADPQQRLLLCRLAAAVLTADGRVSSGERSVYERMLAAWRISDAMVTQAILDDRSGR